MASSILPEAHSVLLSDLLVRLSAEMGRVEAQSLEIETTLAAYLQRHAERPGPGDARPGPALQDLDRVVQTLGELRGFLSRLADGPMEDTRLDLGDAVRAIRLGQLSDSLLGRAHEEGVRCGSVDLF